MVTLESDKASWRRLRRRRAVRECPAARGEEGTFAAGAEFATKSIARYVRLYNVLLYASLTTRFAPLRTPEGLAVLVEQDIQRLEQERFELLSSMTSAPENRVVELLCILANSAVEIEGSDDAIAEGILLDVVVVLANLALIGGRFF